jgi:hypothetical protein
MFTATTAGRRSVSLTPTAVVSLLSLIGLLLIRVGINLPTFTTG